MRTISLSEIRADVSDHYRIAGIPNTRMIRSTIRSGCAGDYLAKFTAKRPYKWCEESSIVSPCE